MSHDLSSASVVIGASSVNCTHDLVKERGSDIVFVLFFWSSMYFTEGRRNLPQEAIGTQRDPYQHF